MEAVELLRILSLLCGLPLLVGIITFLVFGCLSEWVETIRASILAFISMIIAFIVLLVLFGFGILWR